MGTIHTARASATDKDDIVSALNTLPLLVTKITGSVTLAIVYDPDDSASLADSKAIQHIVDAGIPLPDGGKLSALPVSVQELGKLSRAQIAFLTPGLAAHFADIGSAASAASILTLTTDIACVRAAKCVVGIETKPSLSIYYSKEAAENAKIEFSQSFAMVVKQP